MNIVEEFIFKWTNHPSEVVAMRRDISEVIAAAVATEREACARIAQDMIGASRREIAAAIRARSDTGLKGE